MPDVPTEVAHPLGHLPGFVRRRRASMSQELGEQVDEAAVAESNYSFKALRRSSITGGNNSQPSSVDPSPRGRREDAPQRARRASMTQTAKHVPAPPNPRLVLDEASRQASNPRSIIDGAAAAAARATAVEQAQVSARAAVIGGGLKAGAASPRAAAHGDGVFLGGAVSPRAAVADGGFKGLARPWPRPVYQPSAVHDPASAGPVGPRSTRGEKALFELSAKYSPRSGAAAEAVAWAAAAWKSLSEEEGRRSRA